MQAGLNLNRFFNIFLLLNLVLYSSLVFTSKNQAQVNLNALEPSTNLTIQHKSQNLALITLAIELAPGQIIYADSLDLSLDHQNIAITILQTSKSAQNSKDPKLNEALVFASSFKIICEVQLNDSIPTSSPTNLHLSYLLTNQRQVTEKIYPLDLFNHQDQDLLTSSDQNNLVNPNYNQEKSNLSEKPKVSIWEKITKFSQWIQDKLRTSESLSLRLILVFLLGLLMSLTPCIYPMIPITAGVLQAQNSSSIGRSFLLAFTYTLGTSTTFAIFGLIAALTGHLFGQLLVNPFFILVIILILAYLGLSMFGLYDMYVPKFMSQEHNFNQKPGSLLSIFIFGVISGSMASPCLSPGLALLLSIVATLGNNLLGFIMLFIFGLGLSMPLLIIGTFSNSINIIPQSGMWMMEIKKFFGFMLLAMCIYLLNNILPADLITWVKVIFVFGSGVYYLQNSSKHDGKRWYYFKNILGGLLIISSVLLSTQAFYQIYFKQELACENSNWHTNYESALKIAHAQNQKLLIDCGADWCSICKAIDKHVLNDPDVKNVLCDLVLLKVDATNQDSEPYMTIKNKYRLFGVPAILLINPQDQVLIKKWGSDLYDIPKSEFIQDLRENL